MKKFFCILILFTLFNNPLQSQASTFSDVTSNHWAYDSIQFALQQNLVSGYEDHTFRPNNTLTEGHFVKMLANLLYKEDVVQAEKNFVKTKNNSSYEPYYNVLSQKNYRWTNVKNANSHIERDEVAQFIFYAATNRMQTSDVAFQLLKDLNITTATTYEQFDADGNLTRAQATGFLHRLYTNFITLEPAFAPQTAPALETIQLTDSIRLEYTTDETMFVYNDNQLTAMVYGKNGKQLGNVTVGETLHEAALACPYGLQTAGYQKNNITCHVTPVNKYVYFIDRLDGDKVLFAIDVFKDGAATLLNYANDFNSFNLSEIGKLNIILTNQTRAKFNAAPVKLDPVLTEVAQYHATDMATNNFYSHTNLTGQSPSDRAKMMGYHYPYLGEIIFHGPRNTFEAHAGWMNSSGHRSIIINPSYTMIGTGIEAQKDETGNVKTLYYTDNFAKQ